ncbi:MULTISPECIES: cytochrome P450 [unclassified Streptomyces]|uniref:cytochrome P450 n=1 Tax=unclassified Streptomyces TaxID=2593676 RepID=UPI000746DA73|nr:MULTISPECIES: cytochrome P450 [unclassified Streptomyces]KUL58479.1 cytochrome [Streptomyces sp. NRRL S-1521]THC51746.1 cytochrome P450 [Streptomyces sp. A1499]
MQDGHAPLYEVSDLTALDFDPFLRRALRTAPLIRVRLPHGAPGECWLATRHDAVRFVTSDSRFSRDIVGRPLPTMNRYLIPLDRAVSFVDPPDHTRVRSVVASAFNRSGMTVMRPRAQAVLDRLIDSMVAAGPPTDFIEHVTSPFPMHVIGEVLGVPETDRPRLRTWASAVLSRAKDEAEVERARLAKEEARAYFLEVARERRSRPQDDLISELGAAVERGRIEEEELLALVTLMALNGWHAVRNHTSNMVYLLLTDEKLKSRLHSDPEAVPAAVEELLRWIPHKHGVGQARIATEDVEVGGVLVRRGEAVYVSYVAANWDEQCYPEPHRFDIDRKGPPHLAFGYGPHHCVAPLLARMEAELLLTTLLTRLPDLRLAVEPADVPWQKDVLIRGPVTLPVTW